MLKRRPFLKQISAIGLGGMVAFKSQEALSNNEPQDDNQVFFSSEDGYVPTLLQKLENEYIVFSWMSDASAIIYDKKNQSTWRMASVAIQEEDEIERNHVWIRQDRSICEQFPSRFRGEMKDGVVVFTMLNLELQPIGKFICKATLENEYLVFSITDIDSKIPNLTFPPPIENETLVLPLGAGKLIKKSNDRKYLAWVAHLNMRFVAGLNKENKGYVAIAEDGFEDSGIIQLGMNVSPVWQKSLGKYRPAKSMRYCFTNGGYVGIAQKFRAYAISKGMTKTLEEKIKETPELKKLVGGRQVAYYQAIPKQKLSTQENKLLKQEQLEKAKLEGENPPPTISFTHEEVAQSLETLKKEWGFKKGLVNIRGWIKGGYDASHPDIWPPEPMLGSEEQLKKICASDANYFSMLHDNYQDIYRHNPSFPKGINITANGSLMKGGMWAGGQAYILNSRDSVKYAIRNWEQIKTLNAAGIFVDTTSAVQLYQSYEKGNEASKSDDLNNKLALIRFYKSKKQIFGSEETADFAVKDIDFFETRHARKAGETVPLWSLVFHDCAMVSRYVDRSNMELTPKPFLEDMLWGYFVLFRMGTWGKRNEWKQQKEEFMSSLPADEWFAQIATAAMINHEFLTDDFEVEKTTFSNGKSITVNFSKDSKDVNGKKLPPLSFIIS